MNNLRHDKENSCLARSPKSPNILKPKPLNFRKKPKCLLPSLPLSSVNCNLPKTSPALNPVFLRKSPAKCINPFRRNDTKRKREVACSEYEDDSILSQRTKQGMRNPGIQSFLPHSPVLSVDENAHMATDNCKYFSIPGSQDSSNFKKKYLPLDWSLKTRIRLTSPKPFPWRNNFKTSEEASGTTGFVRCLHSDERNCNLDSSYGAKFYQQCLVWMHPCIPWLNLFPRNNDRSVTANNTIAPLTPQHQEVLHAHWCDSFRSLYQLVRACQCPFFYLCASSFTVMFRSGGVGSLLDLHAAIVPTTRGFRQALTAEGIEFTMPLHKDLDEDESHEVNGIHKTESKLENVDDNPEDSDEMHNDEEPAIWLESLGLSQDDFPDLNPKSKLKKRRNIDHSRESLVYVEGSETQALVNFLLNYPSCMSRIGHMAGVPPTLLSPIAFLGSSLNPHKVTHTKILEGTNELFAVELSGPLLPSAVNGLCSLFNTTQDGSFSAVMTPFQPTLAFSKISPALSNFPSAFATENLKDCGLPRSFIQQMCSKVDETDEPMAISIIKAEHGLFSWS